jgi:hypothetical protein
MPLDVQEAARMRSTHTLQEIANRFGVTHQAVQNALTRLKNRKAKDSFAVMPDWRPKKRKTKDSSAVMPDWRPVKMPDWRPVIEDNIPIPPVKRGPGARVGCTFDRRLPLRSMAVGQSLFVPYDAAEYRKLSNRIAGLATRYPIRFTVRQLVENGIKGTRVWRVE